MATQPPEITAIEVEGFKSLHTRQRLELKPLTIIAGANSSGKSSLMQPLLLLKQTLESPFSPSSLVLNGDHVKITNPHQAFSKCPPAAERFEVVFRIEGDRCLITAYAWDHEAGLLPDYTHEDPAAPSFSQTFDPMTIVRSLAGGPAEAIEVLTGRRINPEATMVANRLLSIVHLPGLKSRPEFGYPLTSTDAPFRGPFPPYAASCSLEWQENQHANYGVLIHWLSLLDMASQITVKQFGSTQMEFFVSRVLDQPAEGDLIAVADVGVGVSEVLPLLVALLAAPPGTWVYVEQPETHLHPKAQAALAGILAEGARRGIKVIAETHSSILLTEIQTLVAGGDLAPDDVALHWCVRDRQTGATTVTLAQLDEYGRYGDWPADFSEATLATEERYLEAVSRRRTGRLAS
jgi:hypothetical protein